VNYIFATLNEAEKSIAPAQDYATVFAKLNKEFQPFLAALPKDGKQAETVKELADCLKAYTNGSQVFAKLAQEKSAWWKKQNKDNIKLTEALKEIVSLAEENNKLIKEAELMYRLINRLIDVCLNTYNAKENDKWNTREIPNLKKQVEEVRDTAVNQLKFARYFHHQVQWLIERFPEGELRDVEGLVKLVDKAELKENDWSLTPGRYVGVAPEEVDLDFDFGETMRTIHTELESLNVQAAGLAKKIGENFKKLGI
jgi:type I restriction enzyme M protein